MSKHVEENIVKISFDNKDFEKNIKQSEKSVDSFKGALGGLKDTIVQIPADIVSGLTNVLQNMNIGDIIGTGAILGGIALVNNGIKGIGTTIQSVAASALGTIKSVAASAFNIIKEGGKQRALNIQQAKFLIDGLNLDVNTFMEAANYAVQDTAYGLDSAAKAAAQLGASGVTSLEKLKYSLRGISGVAAMTGATYDEIAEVFTDIAGLGEVTNQELKRLSLRSIDPYLYLGKALGKTREEIQDLAKDGEISFDTFAKAMDDAFGEHAKEANKTFTGVTANIEAALKKIGEGFQTPLITNTLGFLDSIRAGINEFKKELADNAVFTSFTNNVQHVSDAFQNMVEMITDVLDNNLFGDESIMTKFSDLLKYVFDTIDEILTDMSIHYTFQLTDITVGLGNVIDTLKLLFGAAKDAIDEVFGIRHIGAEFQSLVSWVGQLMTSISQIISGENGEGIKAIKNVLVSWLETIKSIVAGIKEILGINKDSIASVFLGAVTAVSDLFKNLKISDDEIDKLTRSAKGLAAIIDIVRMFAVEFFNFIKPAAGYIEPVIDAILTGTASIGDWLVGLRDSIKESEVFKHLFETIGHVFEYIKNLFLQIKDNFLSVFLGKDTDVNEGDSFVSKVIKFILNSFIKLTNLTENVSFDGLNSFLNKVKDLKNNLLLLFGIGKNSETNKENVAGGLSNISDIAVIFLGWITGIAPIVGGIKLAAKEFGIDDLSEYIFKLLHELSDFISTLTGGVGFTESEIIAFTDAAIAIVNALSSIAKFFMVLLDIGMIGLTIIATSNNIKLMIPSIINALTGNRHIYELGEAIKKSLTNIPRILRAWDPVGLKGVFGATDSITSVLKAINDMIRNITASLVIIASIPEDDLNRATGRILGLIGALVGALVVIGIIGAIFQDIGIAGAEYGSTAENKLNEKGKKSGIFENTKITNKNQSKKVGNFLGAAAFLISSITTGLTAVALAMAALNLVIGEPTIANLGKQFVVVGSLLAILGTIFAMMIAIPKNVETKDYGEFLLMSMAFAVITGGLVAIAASLMLLSAVNPANLAASAGIVTLMFAAIGAILTGMVQILGSDADKAAMMLVTAGSLSLIITMLQGLVVTISALVVSLNGVGSDDIDKVKGVLWSITAMIAILALVMGGIVMLGGFVAESKTAMIGMLIVVSALAELCIYFQQIKGLINSAISVMMLYGELLKDIKDFYEFLIDFASKTSDSDASEIAERIEKIMAAVPKGIVKGIFSIDKELINGIKTFYPVILQFVKDDIIPMLNEIFVSEIPDLYKTFIEVIKSIVDMVNKTPVQTFLDLSEFILSALDYLLTLIIDGLSLILDKINEAIPELEPKILTIVMNIIETFNKFISENQESIQKEITYLVNSIVLFLAAAFFSEDTIAEVWNIMADVINVMIEGLAKSAVHLGDLFSKLARFAAQSFFMELATFGLFDSENLFDNMFDESDFAITPTIDLSKIQEGKEQLDNIMANRSYRYEGVYASNASPYQRRQTSELKLDNIGETIKGIFNAAKDKTKESMDVKLEFVPNNYGTMKELGRYMNGQSLAGYDDYGW